jgi:DNA-directed RNA polymerase subunit RPC12/RpoP
LTRAQVSAGPSVVCTVETRLEPGEVVRCVSCHGLYEPARPATPENGVGCPACGETRWLAERVPVVEESSAAGTT